MGNYSVNPIWDGESFSAMSLSNVLWDFDMLQIPMLWTKHGTRGSGVNAYVLDTGVDLYHTSFAGKIVKSKSFAYREPSVLDYNGHGTWCCGKIAGNGIGLAPECNLTSVKVLNSEGVCSDDEITQALRFVLSEPQPHIINMSLGGYEFNAEHDALISDLAEKGCIVAAAAGNESTGQKSYPAAYRDALAVAACDSSKRRADFSNYGDHIAVCAPGVSCYSCVPKGFRRLSGTSMASPTVAGLLALGVSLLLKKGMEPKQIRAVAVGAMKSTAEDLGNPGFDSQYGFGGIDGDKFLSLLAR